MVNIEALIISWLNGQALGAVAFADIPADRPQRFITVERTGGGRDRFIDRPQTVVQVWADSRAEASELANTVAAALQGMIALPEVGRVTVESVVNFPDVSGHPRYQIFITAVTKHD